VVAVARRSRRPLEGDVAALTARSAQMDGSLRSTIGARFPLDQIAAAHELVEAGAGGRVVINVADSPR
jgi:hypothetical protein